TISVGIAELDSQPENYMQWLQRADEALYEAKEGGRNRVVVYHGWGV
ncbi:MAG: sensory box/GGDEF family protein, partial [Marinobacter sp. T13-3]